MEVQEARPSDSPEAPRAEMRIPGRWLHGWLAYETVRRAQPPDCVVAAVRGTLFLSGNQLLLEKNWFKEEHWAKVWRGVVRGYVEEITAHGISLRGDRSLGRGGRVPHLLSRLRERAVN